MLYRRECVEDRTWLRSGGSAAGRDEEEERGFEEHAVEEKCGVEKEAEKAAKLKDRRGSKIGTRRQFFRRQFDPKRWNEMQHQPACAPEIRRY